MSAAEEAKIMNVGSLGLARCRECCCEKEPRMRTGMENSPLLKSTRKKSRCLSTGATHFFQKKQKKKNQMICHLAADEK